MLTTLRISFKVDLHSANFSHTTKPVYWFALQIGTSGIKELNYFSFVTTSVRHRLILAFACSCWWKYISLSQGASFKDNFVLGFFSLIVVLTFTFTSLLLRSSINLLGHYTMFLRSNFCFFAIIHSLQKKCF